MTRCGVTGIDSPNSLLIVSGVIMSGQRKTGEVESSLFSVRLSIKDPFAKRCVKKS